MLILVERHPLRSELFMLYVGRSTESRLYTAAQQYNHCLTDLASTPGRSCSKPRKRSLRPILSKLNYIAASGQGTLKSAAGEALRSAEQVVINRRRMEEGLTELNEVEAAEEQNIVLWAERHNVVLGARYNVKAAGGVAVYGFAILQIVQLFLMWRDEKTSRNVYAPYLLQDEGGVFTINEQSGGLLHFNKYFKNYKAGQLAGQRVEISGDEFSRLEKEAHALWGYVDWLGDFIPGILRRELPVIERREDTRIEA